MEELRNMKAYDATVDKIKGLAWEHLSANELQKVMILSAFAALEFAESLQIALELFPNNASLEEMKNGELETDNLQYGGYSRKANHAAFLWHFIEVYDIARKHEDAQQSGEAYTRKIRSFSRELRAMSIFSREKELPGIFSQILKAKDWSLPGLPEFNYYMRRHIELDSEPGGHADLVSEFEVTDEVIAFYEARLDLYRCIPALFGL